MRASMPPIPNFTDSAWQTEKSDSQLLVSILEGRGTLMPANNGRITRDQARDLVAYVRAFGPRVAVSPGAALTESDFDRAFRQLQRQYDELEKELQKSKSK
jgi:mono/diheme cytochrome c family protein